MMCISALGALRMAQGCSVEFRELCGASSPESLIGSRRALHRATHSLALHTARRYVVTGRLHGWPVLHAQLTVCPDMQASAATSMGSRTVAHLHRLRSIFS